jgi:uncharacterized protein involved in outer membrane biogenesis
MGFVLRIVAGLVMLLAVAASGLWLALERGWLNRTIERLVADAVGYHVVIEEPPSLAWREAALRIELGPLRVLNTRGERLADWQSVILEIAAAPLLDGDVVLPLVEIAGLDVVVERGDDGRLNWAHRNAQDAAAEPGGGMPTLPELRRLVATDARVVYADPQARLELALDTVEGQWGETMALSIDGNGRLNDLPLRVEGGGPSLRSLRDPTVRDDEDLTEATATLAFAETRAAAVATPGVDEITVELDLRDDLIDVLARQGLVASTMPPLQANATIRPVADGPGAGVEASIAIMATEAHFTGELARLAVASDLEGRFRASGPNPGRLLDRLDWPSIETPPFELEGRIERQGALLKLSELDSAFGDSDLAGEMTVDLSGQPVPVTVDLTSRMLDFDDLFPLIGLPPQAGEAETATPTQAAARRRLAERAELLPQATIDPADWRGFDVDLRYRARQIRSAFLPIDRIDAHLVARDGWITLDPVRSGLADGDLLFFGSFDTTQRPPIGRLDARLEGFELQEVMDKLGLAYVARGELGGRVRLEGSGRSIDDLVADARGQIGLILSEGTIDALLLEAVGLDLLEGLIVLIADGDDRVSAPIACGIVNLLVEDGVAQSRPILLDTADSKITASGKIDLNAETLDLLVEAHPKDPSLLSANQPIQVEGAWRSPNVAPAPGGVEDDTLAWLLAPLAALLPFIDLGLADDAPCSRLIAETREQAAEAPGDG